MADNDGPVDCESKSLDPDPIDTSGTDVEHALWAAEIHDELFPLLFASSAASIDF